LGTDFEKTAPNTSAFQGALSWGFPLDLPLWE